MSTANRVLELEGWVATLEAQIVELEAEIQALEERSCCNRSVTTEDFGP